MKIKGDGGEVEWQSGKWYKIYPYFIKGFASSTVGRNPGFGSDEFSHSGCFSILTQPKTYSSIAAIEYQCKRPHRFLSFFFFFLLIAFCSFLPDSSLLGQKKQKREICFAHFLTHNAHVVKEYRTISYSKGLDDIRESLARARSQFEKMLWFHLFSA